MTNHTIRAIATSQAQVGCGTDADSICRALGLDPDTVLRRECAMCRGEGLAFEGEACCDCDGKGSVEVGRIVVQPVATAQWDTTDFKIMKMSEEDQRALRIGRWVLASSNIDPGCYEYGLDYDRGLVAMGRNEFRAQAIAAGDLGQ